MTTVVTTHAQPYSILPNDSIVLTGALDDLQTLSIQQQNISSDTLHLKWEKVAESLPELWDAEVCDNTVCNTTLVDSGMMNPVAPAEYGLLLLHITPHENGGTAVIRYAVWETATSDLKDTLTYILSVYNTSAMAEAGIEKSFNFSPNPAENFISLYTGSTEEYSVEIFNTVGERIYYRLLKTQGAVHSSSINIQDLPMGSYTICIKQQQMTFSRKLIIQR